MSIALAVFAGIVIAAAVVAIVAIIVSYATNPNH